MIGRGAWQGLPRYADQPILWPTYSSAHPMNGWGIPAWLEAEVRSRDKECVYCRVPMLDSPATDGSRRFVATWEHIINDASLRTPENVARCCASCNSSKGTKTLSQWIESPYCKRRGISPDTVSDVVKHALRAEQPER